jgi:hypothetical protein
MYISEFYFRVVIKDAIWKKTFVKTSLMYLQVYVDLQLKNEERTKLYKNENLDNLIWFLIIFVIIPYFVRFISEWRKNN